MKTFPPLLRSCGLYFAMALFAGLALSARLAAQTPAETGIRRLADELRARGTGEIGTARPGPGPAEANGRRPAQEIDGGNDARDEAAATTMDAKISEADSPEAGAAPAAATIGPEATVLTPTAVEAELETDAEAMERSEARRIAGWLAEAARQRQRARKLAAAGRFDEASAAIAGAIGRLPRNPLTESALADLTAEKKSIERTKAEAGRRNAAAGGSEGAPEISRGSGAPDSVAAEPGAPDRVRTRAQLLEEVARSWRRPGLPPERNRGADSETEAAPLAQKLDGIVLANVSFTRTEIGQVVAALGAIAEEFDHTGSTPKGVNLVLLDPSNQRPTVTIALRQASLRRVLDLVTESIGYHYEVQADAVVLRPGGETSALDTAFFPVTRATVLRMAGSDGPGGATAGRPNTFSAAGANRESNPTDAARRGGEGPAMRAFLQQAGVNFEGVPGSSLAYDGAALIVTQTARNLRRIRNILSRYHDVRQVEIEAKFIEVQEGALEELGVNWTVRQKATQHNGAQATYTTDGRSLAGTFGNSRTTPPGRIVRPESVTSTTGGEATVAAALDLPIVNPAPAIPGSANLAAGAGSLATITGIIGEFDVNAVVRALSQQQGTDLLSAPKVTVLSGNPANITVAQEMRYPQSFGQTQSQVGTGSASGGGSAGVTITAGTPQEFTTRNVGVELKVTPTVEEDNYSISLDLNPKVTEFDGFVEYGGPSIAIAGGTTVTVPSGFFQPIFSVRDISTKVTIWDGATLVMGGLTREEVKRVNDKVPILGDLPLIGRMFRSKGESAQKRNLLIFVTANLVNPGGSPKQPSWPRAAAGPPAPSPTNVRPAGAAVRSPDEK